MSLKQTGYTIKQTRQAWMEGKLDSIVDTDAPIIVEKTASTGLVLHFINVGKPWGSFADKQTYAFYSKRDTKRKFRHDFGLIGARLTFVEATNS